MYKAFHTMVIQQQICVENSKEEREWDRESCVVKPISQVFYHWLIVQMMMMVIMMMILIMTIMMVNIIQYALHLICALLCPKSGDYSQLTVPMMMTCRYPGIKILTTPHHTNLLQTHIQDFPKGGNRESRGYDLGINRFMKVRIWKKSSWIKTFY